MCGVNSVSGESIVSPWSCRTVIHSSGG